MPLIGTVTVQSVPNSLFVIVPSKMRDHLKPDNCRLGEIELRYTQKSSHISSRRTTTGGGLLLSRQTVEIAYEVAPEIPVGASTLYQELVIHGANLARAGVRAQQPTIGEPKSILRVARRVHRGNV